MKLILVDDHALFRDGFAVRLKQHESEVQCQTGSSLAEALTLLQTHADTDILLLDTDTPMQGTNSVQAIQ